MIIHCVFCAMPLGAEARAVMAELEAFALGLPGVLAFDSGPNRDFEAKSPGFLHGFVIRFADEAARAAYAEHPTHKALGARLVALCEGGADGIMVFDLDVP